MTTNEQIVRGLYDAFDRGDVPAVFAAFADDVEIRQSDALPWGGTYRGLAGAQEFFGTLTAHVETRIEAERIVAAGDAVVESGRTVGRALASGADFSIAETHVWHLRDGKVVRLEAYVEDAEMLAALGAPVAA